MKQSELQLQREHHAKLEHMLCGGLNADVTETEGNEASQLQGQIHYPGCWKGLDLQLHARWGWSRSSQAFPERVLPLFLLQFQRGGGTLPYFLLMSDPLARVFLNHGKFCLRMDSEAMV